MKNYLLLIIGFMVFPMLVSAQTNKTAEAKIKSYLASSENKKRTVNVAEFDVVTTQFDDKTKISKVQAIQTQNGISISDAILTLATNKQGKIFTTNTFTDFKPNTTKAAISYDKAFEIAAKSHSVEWSNNLKVKKDYLKKDLHLEFSKAAYFASNPEVRLVYIQDSKAKELKLCWMTQLHTPDRQHYYVDFVDAITGEILKSEDKVLHCEFGHGLEYDASPEEQILLDAKEHERHLESAKSWEANYNKNSETHDHSNCGHTVFSPFASSASVPAHKYLVLDLPAEAPNDDSAENGQTIVETAGDPVASPNGWTSLDGITQLPYTHGNNVFAFYDPSPGPLGGIPNPAAGAQATSNNATGEQSFLYYWDLTKDPEYQTTSTNNTFPNRNAAIVNLFYQNNLIHDIFYNFGFDEEGRNFQHDNFGKGGEGNDNVLAQAQDGGGTNNANMLTLQDGVNSQMQMYLWTAAGVDELVQITSVSQSTFVNEGDAFNAIQGAIYSAITPYNLHENPVINKPFVLINDNCGSTNGCGAGAGVGLPPCNTITGSIVLIDRGDCSFVEKVDGAQKGGAAGVIVINNNSSSPDEIIAMGGTDPTGNTINIPAVMVSYNTGLILKESLAEGAQIIGSLVQDEAPAPRRDGDFDNGIIAHEYGHGISSRTSPQGLLGGTLSGNEQGGEGWSDFYALYLTTTESDLGSATEDHPNGVLPNKGIGTYVRYTDTDGPGIRPRKYSIDLGINEYTFAGTTNGGKGVSNLAEITIPHGIGFIWCTMLWEMTQNLVDEYGFNDDVTYNPPSNDLDALTENSAGNNLALKLILEGISLQKPSPSFTDMRDAILLADSLHYDGAHSCLIWKAFAKRGLGVDAINLTNNINDERDGYATPCEPDLAYHDIKIDAPSVLENESNISYTISVENISDAASTNMEVIDVLPDHFTLTSVEGAAHEVLGDKITFTIDEIPGNSTVDLTVNGYVLSETTSNILNTYSYENGSAGWLAITGGTNEFYIKDDGDAQDGISYFHCDNNGWTGGNTILESPTLPITVGQRQVRFWHKFDTDNGGDGGYLEYSVDGVEWIPLPVQQNGYNRVLSGLFNQTYAGPAFSGTVSEYMESTALLPEDAVKMRFVFTEDSAFGGGDGWDIDNVKIVENPVTIASTATTTDPVESGARVYVDHAYTLITGSTKPNFDVKPSMSISPGVVNGDVAPMRVLVDLIEMSGNNTTGPVTVRISKNDYIGFQFDSSITEIGGYEVDNDLFKFTENFLFWEFTTSTNFDANSPLRFGFLGSFDASGQGTMPVSAKTKTVSKLENNTVNDKDNETINYSDQN